jgi:hypothetical protein
MKVTPLFVKNGLTPGISENTRTANVSNWKGSNNMELEFVVVFLQAITFLFIFLSLGYAFSCIVDYFMDVAKDIKRIANVLERKK